MLGNHVIFGVKPKFTLLTGDSPYVRAANARTCKEIDAYLARCEWARRMCQEAAEDVVKENISKILKRIAVAVTMLALAIIDADKDQEEIRKEAEAEKARINKEIEALNVQEEFKKAEKANLEKQFVTWSDWWNNTTGSKKQDCELALLELSARRDKLVNSLKVKDMVLAEIDRILSERSKERDELVFKVGV